MIDVIVSGDRNHKGKWLIFPELDAIRDEFGTIRVSQGAAYPPLRAGRREERSADYLAHLWCLDRGVEEKEYPANWALCTPTCPDKPHRKSRNDGSTYCPLAGHARNQDMVNAGARLLVAFPLPGSRGTWDCVRRAKAAGIEVRVIRP